MVAMLIRTKQVKDPSTDRRLDVWIQEIMDRVSRLEDALASAGIEIPEDPEGCSSPEDLPIGLDRFKELG